MPADKPSPDTLVIGCHLSIARGFERAGLDAVAVGANTFQFFTRNPRGGRAKALDVADLEKLAGLVEEHRFGPLFAHAPYTLNLCSDKPSVRRFAAGVLEDDLQRVSKLPATYYILHPGSHVGMGAVKGIELIAAALDKAIEEGPNVTILLEGMSGKGSEIGGTFQELRAIIDSVERNESIGVCLDTCHLYSAGYDIVKDLDGVLQQLDDVLGLDRLHAVHLNDSKVELGSKKDRHAAIGEGVLGLDAIGRLINHPALRSLPFNLETPHDDLEGWAREIRVLRERYL